MIMSDIRYEIKNDSGKRNFEDFIGLTAVYN